MMICQASKEALLQRLYAIHAEQCARFDLVCSEQCAACCTGNVTLTTLEGVMLLKHLDAGPAPDWRDSLAAAALPDRYQPRMTLNELADRCARDMEVPDDAPQRHGSPCPFLTRAPAIDLCLAYQARPFGCRAMVSQQRCRRGSAARMPDFLLTLNTVMLQYIEGLDVPGLSGNLIDVLTYLEEPQNRLAYEQQLVREPWDSLVTNRPVPVLMVPPEHRAAMQPVLTAIQSEFKRVFLQSGLDT